MFLLYFIVIAHVVFRDFIIFFGYKFGKLSVEYSSLIVQMYNVLFVGI